MDSIVSATNRRWKQFWRRVSAQCSAVFVVATSFWLPSRSLLCPFCPVSCAPCMLLPLYRGVRAMCRKHIRTARSRSEHTVVNVMGPRRPDVRVPRRRERAPPCGLFCQHFSLIMSHFAYSPGAPSSTIYTVSLTSSAPHGPWH